MSPALGISARGRSELGEVLSGRRFITPDDVVAAIGGDATIAAKRLAQWARQGWLRRVHRGLYIPVPVDAASPDSWTDDALVVANEVWAPCYFTGWTAAQHWGLTEQSFRTVLVKTTRRVRTTRIDLLDHDYVLSHVPEGSLEWGLSTVWRADARLSFADPARTVVEMLDSPRLGGGVRHVAEVVTAYLEDQDASLLVDYGDRLGNSTVFKRLGYLAETLAEGDATLLAACSERIGAGIGLLDPDAPDTGRRSMRWGLRLNVTVVNDGAS